MLLHIIIRHNLAIALIQVKLAVDLLLLNTNLAKTFLMLKGTVKLHPVIGERLFHAFTFRFLFLDQKSFA